MEEFIEYKELLIKRYANVVFRKFKNCKDKQKTFDDIKKNVGFTGNIKEVVSYLNDKTTSFNSYKRYVLITNDTFYGVDLKGNKISFKLNDIKAVTTENALVMVLFVALPNSLPSKGFGIVECYSGKKIILDISMSKELKGFAIINSLKSVDDDSFSKFLLQKNKKFLGEYIEWRLTDNQAKKINNIFQEKSLGSSVTHLLKLVEINLDSAFFQISIKDTDIKSEENPYGFLDEWELQDVIELFNNEYKLKKIFQDSILDTIGIYYDLNNIYFIPKYKISLKTRAENAMYHIENVTYKISDITEKRFNDVQRKYNKSKGE